MLRLRLFAVPCVGLALFGVASAAESQDAVLTSAALAPYRDELLRDAPALCSDLTRPPTIVPSVSQGAVWEQAVQSVFAAASPSLPNDMALSLRATASHLTVDGHDATGIFSLIASEPTTEHGAPDAKIVSLGRYQLSLEEVAGRWLVSSRCGSSQ
jgi:hypothetical protein